VVKEKLIMPGVIFRETLRRSWRGMLIWGIGIALIGAMQALTLPDVDALQDYANLMETMPPALIQAVGGGDAAFFATPEGYLASQFYGIALIIFAIYALVAGLNITVNEEDRGVLDIVISLPVPRWRVIVERLAAYTVMTVAIVAITFIGMWASLVATPSLQINTTRLFEATINVLPGTLLVLAATTLIGTVLRRRGAATGIAVFFVIGSYFIDFIGAAASGTLAESLRAISFYRYYNSTGVMQNGLMWGNVLLLMGVAAVCVVGSLWFFERRDIAV
jgi:ABC-2 type transport system permease protein